jgi:radical SAM superfamily enzyme YgiQ (UPF0313 family)
LRVLLVHPSLLPSKEVSPPLGLCTLASWLTVQGHDVLVLDLDLELKDPDLSSDYQYLPIFRRALREYAPSAIGFTSMYSNSPLAVRLIRAAKEIDDSVVTIAGGSHFGALAGPSLQRIPELDFVIEGEAETAFAALLDALGINGDWSGIPRLAYRRGAVVHTNPRSRLINLGDLPPIWHTLGASVSLQRYARTIPPDSARRIIYIEAGRGCPFACTFCATAPFWQRQYRVKPVEAIIEEIRYLYEEHDYTSFVLVHDLLTVNENFISAFSDALLDARLPIEWMANSRSDIRLHGLLPKMKASGCWKLFLGIESASPKVQADIRKGLRVPDTIECINNLTAHGLSATCSFVFGFPEETPEEVGSSISLGARLKLIGADTVQFHRLRLFPPSPLTSAGLKGEFDPDSIRIEYPFPTVEEADLRTIAEDQEFYAGYWPPQSTAGSKEQLAQVEMFFHHLVAMMPLTLCAICSLCGDALLPSFYRALEKEGAIRREDLDWENGAILDNVEVIAPLLRTWIEECLSLGQWQRQLLDSLYRYERHRLQFVANGQSEDILAQGDRWAVFAVQVKLRELLAALQHGKELSPALLEPGRVALVREGHMVAAYILPGTSMDALSQAEAGILESVARMSN